MVGLRPAGRPGRRHRRQPAGGAQCGAIYVDSADKAARFISLCDAFGIPLVFLHDVPGFMVGVEVERQGIIRHGAKMIAAMSAADVPKYTVVLRKAYAAGYYAMCAPGFEPRATIALPTATIGPMSAEAPSTPCTPTRSPPSPTTRSATPTSPRARRAAEPTSTCCGWAATSFVDAVVEPGDLRAELVARMADADRWTRATGRRHHLISPV